MPEMNLELCTLINCFQIKWKQKRYKCKIWSEDDANQKQDDGLIREQFRFLGHHRLGTAAGQHECTPTGMFVNANKFLKHTLLMPALKNLVNKLVAKCAKSSQIKVSASCANVCNELKMVCKTILSPSKQNNWLVDARK